MKVFVNWHFRYLSVLVAACFLAACSSITNEILPIDMNHSWKMTPYVVNVQTDTNFLVEKDFVFSANFRFVLEEAIIKSQLFRGVLKGQGKADYLLTVDVKQSRYSYSLGIETAEIVADWTLKRLKDKKVVFRKTILSRPAGPSVIFGAGEGKQEIHPMARAARENIQQGMTAMANSSW